jgi:hypothetical protein
VTHPRTGNSFELDARTRFDAAKAGASAFNLEAVTTEPDVLARDVVVSRVHAASARPSWTPEAATSA